MTNQNTIHPTRRSLGDRYHWVCLQPVKAGERLLLFTLINWTNADDWTLWPSVAAIAKQMGASKATVHASLRRLTDYGLLEEIPWEESGKHKRKTKLRRMRLDHFDGPLCEKWREEMVDGDPYKTAKMRGVPKKTLERLFENVEEEEEYEDEYEDEIEREDEI